MPLFFYNNIFDLYVTLYHVNMCVFNAMSVKRYANSLEWSRLYLTRAYHNRNFIIPKIIVVFRIDLHKMKIKHRIIGEYATKRCFFDIKKLTIVTGS
jgi:hypothetical protein